MPENNRQNENGVAKLIRNCIIKSKYIGGTGMLCEYQFRMGTILRDGNGEKLKENNE